MSDDEKQDFTKRLQDAANKAAEKLGVKCYNDSGIVDLGMVRRLECAPEDLALLDAAVGGGNGLELLRTFMEVETDVMLSPGQMVFEFR